MAHEFDLFKCSKNNPNFTNINAFSSRYNTLKKMITIIFIEMQLGKR